MPDYETEFEAVRQVATKLDVSAEALRKWRRTSEIDSGTRPGMTTVEHAELKRLKKENAELRRAKETLKEASAFIAAELDAARRDDLLHRQDEAPFRVEAICRKLSAAESGFMTARGYRAVKIRPPSARRLSDGLLGAEIARLREANYGVYGVRKMHRAIRRHGWDQTGRIMRDLGLAGVRQSKKVFTTRPDPADSRPTDLVERCFTADAPRRLWVADITYVRTWSGLAYVAFVTDVFSRRIIGFNVASTLKADILPLQALDMAGVRRRP